MVEVRSALSCVADRVNEVESVALTFFFFFLVARVGREGVADS